MRHSILTLFFLFVSQVSFAQKLKFTIRGSIESVGGNKFAYLFIKGVDNIPERLFVAPINSGQFSFIDSVEQNGRLYTTGLIFIDARDDISIDEVKEMRKDGEFFIERTVLFVLNDTVLIKIMQPLKKSIINGGVINSEYTDLRLSIQAGKEVEFINTHLDSPFSLLYLKALAMSSQYMKSFSTSIDLKAMYNTLSDRIRNSIEGKEFAKEYL